VLRKALFQIHLWTGVALALYVVVIGASGAALVFRPEMQKAAYPQFFTVARAAGQPDADIAEIVRELGAKYPASRLLGIDYPTGRRATYLSYLTQGDRLLTVFSHPVSATVLGELPGQSWITRLQDLHFNLFAGSVGRVINGIGALSLIVMFGTGFVVWWPDKGRPGRPGRWRGSLTVSFRKGRKGHESWKRTNWQLHSAAGFWLFAVLMLWAITGVEFAFPRQFRKAINAALPLTVVRPPESSPRPGGRQPDADADLHALINIIDIIDIIDIIHRAKAAVPGAKMGRIVLPATERAPLLILMAYVDHGDFDTSDEVLLYFDRYSGQLLQRRDQGLQKQSAGDFVMAWIGPLHTGSFGGSAMQSLWTTLALSFPLLAVTGTVMWWNRVVRRRGAGFETRPT
jgi:uncharacterized iron-regulated membrane protein